MIKTIILFINLLIILAIQFDRKRDVTEDNLNVVIEGTVGTPSPVFSIVLNLDTPLSYAYNNDYYQRDKSFAYRSLNKEIKLPNNDTGTLATELLTLNNYTHFHFDKFQFLCIHLFKQQPIQTIFLGFGRGNFSFPNQLKKRDLITKNIFHITSSQVAVGHLINNETEDLYAKCKLLNETMSDSQTNYSCRLKGVFFYDSKDNGSIIKNSTLNLNKYQLLSNNTSVTFTTSQLRIRFPLYFFDYFEKNYFRDNIEDKNCRVFSFVKTKYVTCSKEIVNSFPSIVFAFDEMVLEYQPQDFFVTNSSLSGNQKRFIIGFHEKYNSIVFGYHVIEKYSMWFSEDDNFAGFARTGNYVKEMTIKFGNEVKYATSSKLLNYIIYIGIIINLFGVVIICFIKKSFKVSDNIRQI